jgi:ribonuclease P protein subunit POP4
MIVTEKDEVKTIPKEQTIFRFTVPLPSADDEDTAMSDGDKARKALTFELHGSQFENRPVDRANKKFKWRNVEYI